MNTWVVGHNPVAWLQEDKRAAGLLQWTSTSPGARLQGAAADGAAPEHAKKKPMPKPGAAKPGRAASPAQLSCAPTESSSLPSSGSGSDSGSGSTPPPPPAQPGAAVAAAATPVVTNYADARLQGSKTFFIKARIMAGQADVARSALGWRDFRWAAKDEAEPLVRSWRGGSKYWHAVEDALAER